MFYKEKKKATNSIQLNPISWVVGLSWTNWQIDSNQCTSQSILVVWQSKLCMIEIYSRWIPKIRIPFNFLFLKRCIINQSRLVMFRYLPFNLNLMKTTSVYARTFWFNFFSCWLVMHMWNLIYSHILYNNHACQKLCLIHTWLAVWNGQEN